MGKQHCHIVGSKKLKFNSWSSKLVVFVLNLEPAKTQYWRGHPAKRTTAEGWFSFTTGGATKMPREHNWQSITHDCEATKKHKIRWQKPVHEQNISNKFAFENVVSWLRSGWLSSAQCLEHGWLRNVVIISTLFCCSFIVFCVWVVVFPIYPYIQCSRALPSSRPVVCSPDFLRFFSGFSLFFLHNVLVGRRIAFRFEVISITSCPVLYSPGVATVIWFTSSTFFLAQNLGFKSD